MTRVERAILDTSVVIDYPADEVAAVALSVAVSPITLAELIAAVAVSSDSPLITRNARDFDGLHRALTLIPVGS